MASPPPSRSSSAAKRGHNRVVSSSRTPLARHLTKGPLDVDDSPVDEARPPLTSRTVTAEAANIPIPTTPFSPERAVIEAVPVPPPPPVKDYSYLLQPELYHPLSQLDLPPPFRTQHHQPHPSTPIPELLSHHNFRSAAIAAALRLCAPPAPPPPELFSLIYTRLACLTLINHLPFAAEESKALQDIFSPFYIDDATGKNVLPWELRVLAVRLQGIGYGDARRGVSGCYELAREARAEVKKCSDAEGKQIWKDRLRELGFYVANALIESGNLGAAARHLESLRVNDGKGDETLNGRLALLYIELGDIDTARKYISNTTSNAAALEPLLSMAEGRYADAVSAFQALPPGDIVTQNLAVCLFYAGRVDETLELLDGLVGKGRSFHSLTFNLVTVYELCSERGRERKGELVARVARIVEEKGGGERGLVDFKL